MTKVSTITPCFNMGKYMQGFLQNLSKQTHDDIEVVIDHNNPSDEEVIMIEEFNKIYDNIFHIQVEGVDPIGISMNRCIENAERITLSRKCDPRARLLLKCATYVLR